MIDKIDVSHFTVPTDSPEADGTLEWNSTTIVVCEAFAHGVHGVGYSYASGAAAKVIQDTLAGCVIGRNPMDISRAWEDMRRAVRNFGSRGIAATAISAVDAALWDLKSTLLGVPLASLLGAVREEVAIYGSGGFTSYPIDRLTRQLAGWANEGIARVKMKVGAKPSEDLARVRAARDAIGSDVALFVDANGAYARKQALAQAERFAEFGVAWFEEPVSSDDLAGLRLMRDRAPSGMDIAAGEYGYEHFYFRRMLEAGAVDVLQADATRCLGITGFLRAAAMAEAHSVPLSAHCAPALHLHLGCAVQNLRHLEYFHDHARIERLLFDGVAEPHGGSLRPDMGRPGLGLKLRSAEAKRYAA